MRGLTPFLFPSTKCCAAFNIAFDVTMRGLTPKLNFVGAVDMFEDPAVVCSTG
jgi:hypothetical protein